ncbi:hypothetical protein [Saccharicrinis sp. FJH54]|uniref:hypothetical protein n=1 Tax=Saccharicrinis sp. FJH54 TaxID=3344665 RepID=UPI0035D409FF
MVKTLTLLISLAILSSSVYAQIEKSTITLHGSIFGNIGTTQIESNSPYLSYSLGFNPGVGYFIVDNFEVILTPKLVISNSEYSGSAYNGLNLAFGAGVNKYFGSKPLLPYVGVMISRGNERSDWGGSPLSVTIITQGVLEAGLAYFINESICIKCSLNYTHSNSKYLGNYGEDDSTSSITKRNNINFGFGFGFFL